MSKITFTARNISVWLTCAAIILGPHGFTVAATASMVSTAPQAAIETTPTAGQQSGMMVMRAISRLRANAKADSNQTPVKKKYTMVQHATHIAKKHKIPPKVFLALIQQESGWNHRAVSRVGAIGLTQVMPYNVKAMGYNVSSFRSSPIDQLEAGAKYLKAMYGTFGRWDLALAAYNAGPGAVKKYKTIPPYRETVRYVRNILRMASV